MNQNEPEGSIPFGSLPATTSAGRESQATGDHTDFEGSSQDVSVTVGQGDAYTLPESPFKPARGFFEFVGWGRGEEILQPGDEVAIDESTRFYAVYTETADAPASVEMRLYPGKVGGYYRSVGTKSSPVYEGEPYKLPDPTAWGASYWPHPGYEFIGWARSANGVIEHQAGDTVTAEDGLHLFARWRYVGADSAYATVTFDANGGTGWMSDAVVNTRDYYNLPECSYELPGYRFTGWSYRADCSPETGGFLPVGHGDEFAPDTTLYAVWELVDPALAVDRDMRRLYNPNSGEHFYTASDAERDWLVSLGWHNEGEGWKAPNTSSIPVHRLYNPNAGDHHYTCSKTERDHLVSVGWNYEGIGWYSVPEAEGAPLYRLYNPNAQAGSHHYTLDKAENDWLVSLGWNAEDVGWYGVG